MVETAISKSLSQYHEMIRDCISNIDEAVEAELNRYKKFSFHEPLLYALKGGKRIRPLLLILSADSIGRRNEDPYPAAIAVELSHTESLIHDDLIDGDSNRRGRGSFHIRFGQHLGILSADFVLAMILNLISKYEDPRIGEEFALAACKMCEGELVEINTRNNVKNLDWETYLDIIEKKTASSFYASAKIGAILGGGEEWEIESLSGYGKLLGMAYQMKDDSLDWDGKKEVANELVALPKGVDIPNHLRKMAEDYSAKAKKKLSPLKDSRAKMSLLSLSDYVVQRDS